MNGLTLSVYTISFGPAGYCLPVIRDLRKQSICAEIELIVVADSTDGLDERELSGFGGYQLIRMPGLRTIGVAMARAVRAARAPLVTYAEEHATFDADWARELVAAHARGYGAVGFAMRNANPDTLTSWAHMYGQFGPAVDPVETSEVPLLTGHHASYSRELLLSYGGMLEAMLEDECALFLDLRRRGHKLLMEGRAISYHINLSRLSAYATLDFHGQRGFAAARAMAGRWPWWKRVAYACGSPLVPLVRLRRILFHLHRTGQMKQLMPGILGPMGIALLAGGVGEGLGYVFGGGASAEQKFGPELRRRDFLATSDLARSSGAGGDRAS